MKPNFMKFLPRKISLCAVTTPCIGILLHIAHNQAI